jgi:hypothetical protein
MLTFSCTSLAAAPLRRTRETRKSTRPTIVALRTVRLGFAWLAVVATASMSQAGGMSAHPAGNFSGMSSHNNGGTSNPSNLFNSTQTNSVKQFASNKPIAQNNLSTTTKNQTSNQGIVSNKLSKSMSLDSTKSNPLKLTSGNKMQDQSKGSNPCHDKFCCSCCHTCPWWYCWNYPCWCPLYSCSCGDWEDVPLVAVPQGLDLQLLAVRMLDSGDPDQQQGPAFRVWFRNNSAVAINHPFNILTLAARDTQPTADLPQAGVRVASIDAGQTLSVDIRLPVEANQPGFPMLHVLVDSHREIPEVDKTNNGLVINRADVLPVEQTPSVGETPSTITAPNPPAPPAPTPTDGSEQETE